MLCNYNDYQFEIFNEKYFFLPLLDDLESVAP